MSSQSISVVSVPILALVLVTALWGVTFVQVKDAIAVYPLFAFLAVRYAIATAALGLGSAGRLHPGPIRRRCGRRGRAPRGSRHRVTDRGARPNDGLEHRLHHRPL